jgi:phage/plasmid-associated DNA primase
VEEYRKATDELGPFLDDACERAPDFWAPTADLFKAYQRWAEHEGDRAMGKTAFGRLLKQHGCTEARRGARQTRGWQGLRLRSDALELLGPDRSDR